MHAGTRFAIAAGAAVQFTADGIMLVIRGPVPQHLPQSAVSGEAWAITLMSRILCRGTEDGQDLGRHSVKVGVDCKAIIAGYEAHCRRDRLSGKSFPYAGVLRNSLATEPIEVIFKIKAHTAEIDAIQQGWGERLERQRYG